MFHDNRNFTKHVIIGELPIELYIVIFINNITTIIEILLHRVSQNNSLGNYIVCIVSNNMTNLKQEKNTQCHMTSQHIARWNQHNIDTITTRRRSSIIIT